MAAEEASFNTSIDSTSFILKVFSCSWARGTPSTTYKGEVPAVIVPVPRTLICKEEPGAPVDCETCTPGILPTIASAIEVTGCPFKSLARILAIAVVTSRFFCTPYPTTTTSSNNSLSSFIIILSSPLPFAFSSTV